MEFVKHGLYGLTTSTGRGLRQTRCDQAWLPSAGTEGGELPPDELGLHLQPKAPEQTRGLNR